MKYPTKLTPLACVLALAVPVIPSLTHAGEGIDSSGMASMMISLAPSVIVSAPLSAVSWSLGKLHDASSASKHHSQKSRRSADDRLPDMEVKEVGTDEHGAPRVQLAVPGQPDHTITLIWPAREDNPAAGFQQGTLVSFQPSPLASGWLLRDDTGTALAFLPLTENASEAHSTLF